MLVLELRAAGVMVYCELKSLLSSSRISAFAIIFYVIIITSAHLPFPMNTRLRIPFVDPLLAVLAGSDFYFLICKYQHRRDQAEARPLPEVNRAAEVTAVQLRECNRMQR
jgi:hypothetical protein